MNQHFGGTHDGLVVKGNQLQVLLFKCILHQPIPISLPLRVQELALEAEIAVRTQLVDFIAQEVFEELLLLDGVRGTPIFTGFDAGKRDLIDFSVTGESLLGVKYLGFPLLQDLVALQVPHALDLLLYISVSEFLHHHDLELQMVDFLHLRLQLFGLFNPDLDRKCPQEPLLLLLVGLFVEV